MGREATRDGQALQDSPPGARDHTRGNDSYAGITAQKKAAWRAVVAFTEGANVLCLASADRLARLDLHRHQLTSLFQYEVHLLSATQPPMIEPAGGATVLPYLKVRGDQCFEVKSRGF